jgi:hypothetical protein
MPRKAIGERADHDGRKAEERYNGFKVGKVHWCYPSLFPQNVVDKILVILQRSRASLLRQ